MELKVMLAFVYLPFLEPLLCLLRLLAFFECWEMDLVADLVGDFVGRRVADLLLDLLRDLLESTSADFSFRLFCTFLWENFWMIFSPFLTSPCFEELFSAPSCAVSRSSTFSPWISL
jgi:hypothetical protein